MQEFRLGCAVWSYRGWLGNFYPKGSSAKDFLKLYGDRLHAVEGNTTFYAVPAQDTLVRWREQTPPDFRFCLKFPQTVTHQGLLCPQLEQAKSFIARVQLLEERLGCIFAQLPPNYSPAYFDDLQAFLKNLTAITSIKLGLEVRHLDWFNEPHRSELNRLLDLFNSAKVLLDTRPIYNCPDNPQAHAQRRKPNVPLYFDIAGNLAMVRFISHPDSRYNTSYLQEWVQQIHQWWTSGKSIYFFIHCPDEARSPHTALAFQALLEQASVPVSPIPWQQLPPEPQQLSLF